MIAELEKERTKLKEWYETTRIDERDEEQREVRQTRNKKKVITPMTFMRSFSLPIHSHSAEHVLKPDSLNIQARQTLTQRSLSLTLALHLTL